MTAGIPVVENVCNAHTMDEQYSIVYKISLASMNLLVPMAWAFLLLVKTSHNLEKNLHVRDEWSKDLTVILVINFAVCWIVKQVSFAASFARRPKPDAGGEGTDDGNNVDEESHKNPKVYRSRSIERICIG